MPTVHPRSSISRQRSTRRFPSRFGRTSAGLLGAVLVLASCAGDPPTGANEPNLSADLASASRLSVCHRTGATGTIVEVPLADLAERLRQGDYLTSLFVSHASDQPSDGAHFRRIGDALAAARSGRLARGEFRSAACRITIAVAAGAFRGTAFPTADKSLERFPLVVDVPAITLRGALVMELDAAGRATGHGVGGIETTLVPVRPMPILDVSIPVIVANGHPSGPAAHGLAIEGFVFQSGHHIVDEIGGQAVFASRVRGLAIRSNRIESGFSESIDLRESSATIKRNHLEGTGGTCDICLAGPGTYLASGNWLGAGGIPGFLTVPAIGTPVPDGVEPTVLPKASTVTAEIVNNEVRDHLRVPVGVGIRFGGLGILAPDVHGTIHGVVRDNLLVNNNFAMIFEAAFPTPDTELRADMDIALSGNVMQQSCQANLLVALTRHTTALGLTDFPYLRNSTYRLSLGGNLQWKDVWFGNAKGYGNRLVVDGRTIAYGTRQFYDPDTCPGGAALASAAP